MPKPENLDSLRNNLADTVKLKYRISEEERKLPALYEALGKLAFERFSEGHATDPTVIEKCGEIKVIKDALAEMQAQLEAIREGKTEEPVAEEPPAPQTSVFDELGAVPVFGKPAPAEFCTNCGAKLLAGAAFCLNCGKKLEPAAEPETKPETPPEPKSEPKPEPEAEPAPEPVAKPAADPEPEASNDAPAFCTKCGAKLLPGTMFCTKCGAKAWKPEPPKPAKIPEFGTIPESISGIKPDLPPVNPDLPDVKPDLSSISVPEVAAEIPQQIDDLADKIQSNVKPDPGLTFPSEPPKPVTRFCTQCGNKLVGDLPFCPICGHKR